MRQMERKRCKTFPLEMEEDLHKALKYKAIESDQTLHAFIINTLAEKIQEEPAKYFISDKQTGTSKEKKK